MADHRLTRRELLAAATGMACAWTRHEAKAQGFLANLAPEEPVEATIKRLFAGRALRDGSAVMTLEVPLIAEDGGNVAITVDANLPVSGASHVSHLYIIADKNRRPMLAKFSFTPESGRAFVSTSIRLATTTDVRAVVEMNDGKLFAVSKSVRVTISGCDLPPAG